MPRTISEIRTDLAAAKERRDRLSGDMENYVDRSDLTGGEQEHYDRINRGYQKAVGDIEVFDGEMREAMRDSARRGHYEDGDGPRGLDGYDDRGQANLSRGLLQSGRPYNRRDEDDIISRARRTVDAHHKTLTSAQGDAVTSLLQAERSEMFDPGYVARRIEVTMSPAYQRAFWQTMDAAMSGMPALLSQEEVEAVRSYRRMESLYQRGFDAYNEMARAESVFGASSAGLGVPGLVDPSILISSGAAGTPLLRVCSIRNTTVNLWKGVSAAGMTWSYSTEGTENTDNAPSLSQPSIAIHKAQGWLPYSVEAASDYGGTGGGEFAAEFGKLIDQGYTDLLATMTMTGTGVGQPTGAFVAMSNATSVITPTTDGSFGGVDVFKTWVALPERFRGNATWVMSAPVAAAIRQFAANQSLAQSAYFTVDLTGGEFRLMDKPVIISDYAPLNNNSPGSIPGTTGLANILSVSDWGQSYAWINRAGMSIEQVPIVFGASQRPTGQRGFWAWSRNGGGALITNGCRQLQNQ
jgi:HK97 family phage major capsid protein